MAITPSDAALKQKESRSMALCDLEAKIDDALCGLVDKNSLSIQIRITPTESLMSDEVMELYRNSGWTVAWHTGQRMLTFKAA